MTRYRDADDPITEPWQRPADTPGYVPTHADPVLWTRARRLRDARDQARAQAVLIATDDLPASRVLYALLIASGALRPEVAA